MCVQLSKNFQLYEFAVSNKYPELAEEVEFSLLEIERLRFICAAYLQPLRGAVGPITITSGKRTAALNKAVDGIANSDHLFLEDSAAVDITAHKVSANQLGKLINVICPNFKIMGVYSKSNFVHLSFPDSTGKLGVVYTGD